MTCYCNRRKQTQRTRNGTGISYTPVFWLSTPSSLQRLPSLAQPSSGCSYLSQGPHQNSVPCTPIPQMSSVCCVQNAISKHWEWNQGYDHCPQEQGVRGELDTHVTDPGMRQAVACIVPELWTKCSACSGKNEISISWENLNYSSHLKKKPKAGLKSSRDENYLAFVPSYLYLALGRHH